MTFPMAFGAALPLRSGVLWLLGAALSGCGSEPVDSVGEPTPPPDPANGIALSVDVGASERVFVDLAGPKVVSAASAVWDIAFEGYEIFTNGGVSGTGAAAAFGPLGAPVFLSDTAPEMPLSEDEAGGAFLRWYAYDSSEHVLLSRFHTYGIRDGGSFYKVQITSYYGLENGALASARYQLRTGTVGPGGAGTTRTIAGLNASGTDSGASECLNLESGVRTALTVEEAMLDDQWHLCFRRDAISVNGGAAGPRGVEGVDLDRDATSSEELASLRERTAESEALRFEGVGYAELSDAALPWQLDRVVSAFTTGRWVVTDSDPPQPIDDAVWLVAGDDGASHYFVRFERFVGATLEAPGRVELRVKAVK